MADRVARWREGLAKTSSSAFGRLASVLGATEITGKVWESLEALLIQGDLGVDTTNAVMTSLRARVQREGMTTSRELRKALRAELLNRLMPIPTISITTKPWVLLVVGVNGSGKTTTLAKLGNRFRRDGRTILLGAADTFRAAADDQLRIWGERLGAAVISGAPESDPGSVAFQTVQAAVARGIDIVLVDTAGRLQTRFNLMEELKKVHRVVGKALPGAPHAVWLVLDATLGQNTLQQARAFAGAIPVNGVILAKLDLSAKGGMAFAVQRELGLPILFAGLGEQLDDLQPFDREAFVDGILAG